MLKRLFSWGGGNRQPLFEPRMPEVDEREDVEAIFAQARSSAAGGTPTPPGSSPGRHWVIVTPGRMLMFQPCPPAGSMPAGQVQHIEKLIPPTVKRNIAAIAYTELTALRTDAAKAIPFLGLLLGFAYIGHSVWVFEGHASALAAGCRDADVRCISYVGAVSALADHGIEVDTVSACSAGSFIGALLARRDQPRFARCQCGAGRHRQEGEAGAVVNAAQSGPR